MTAVLEGLDHINWSRLGHAYGPAEDVPGQIRALRSADAQERKTALWELYGNIFHQGTRYEATPHAVPFLLEVLAAPDTEGRAQVLGLLASIAMGYDESWLPDGIPVARFREAAAGGEALLTAAPHPGDEDFDEDEGDYAYLESLSEADRNRLHTYVELAAYDAVRAGVYLFRELLADTDPDVRQAAAYTMAWFPEERAGAFPAGAAGGRQRTRGRHCLDSHGFARRQDRRRVPARRAAAGPVGGGDRDGAHARRRPACRGAHGVAHVGGHHIGQQRAGALLRRRRARLRRPGAGKACAASP
jgi:hypothetical protein